MASSSNAPRDQLFAAVEEIHVKLASELNKQPEVKPGIHMMLITSVQDNLTRLNKAADTGKDDDKNLAWNTVYDPVYHYGGRTIENVKLTDELSDIVVKRLNERKTLVKAYLAKHIEKSHQTRVCAELMSDLNGLLSTKFTSGVFVDAPRSS
jgi:hypothetical protein